jgi:hypothetical protein
MYKRSGGSFVSRQLVSETLVVFLASTNPPFVISINYEGLGGLLIGAKAGP